MMDRRFKWLLTFSILLMQGTMATPAAKNTELDSLQQRLEKVKDTAAVQTLMNIGYYYAHLDNYTDALSNYLNALKLAETLNNKQYYFLALNAVASFYEKLGKHDAALGFALKAEKIAEEQDDKINEFDIYDLIGGIIYFNQGKYDLAIPYGQRMLKIAEESRDKRKIVYMQMWFGDLYREQRKYDKSFADYSKALQGARDLGDKFNVCECLNGLGLVYGSQANYSKALVYYQEAFDEAIKDKIYYAFAGRQVANSYYHLKNYDQAEAYLKKSLNGAGGARDISDRAAIYNELHKAYYADKKYKEAYDSFLKYTLLNDSIQSAGVQNKMNLLQANYDSEKQKRAFELISVQNRQQKIVLLFVIAGLFAAGIFSAVLIRSNRQKQKANTLLKKQQQELKAAEAQLIQSEKMASLGELTAGIAHEIQNPLNFVNNFSEVNQEMLDELDEELEKGDIAEAKAIAADIRQNEQKINHHGKRADSIVKGMLEHSRANTGQKQLTDMNVLCDEFLKLSYHGLRAKDKLFNAEMITNFDPKLPKVNASQQDMGRVMLNLFSNAFYAVSQKIKSASPDYKPEVSVTTSSENGHVVIKVRDNGIGIPDSIKDKIMQPFFTTKPTGEGTGLGLSLTYDMVVKGHGGSMQVNSIEREWSEFVVTLPIG